VIPNGVGNRAPAGREATEGKSEIQNLKSKMVAEGVSSRRRVAPFALAHVTRYNPAGQQIGLVPRGVRACAGLVLA
jgi:hypothetical protein